VGSLEGRLIAGKYKMKCLIGKGGMGAVYEAEQVDLRRTVALKVLATEGAARPDLLHRFEREARLCASIGHDNIIGIFDVGKTEDGMPYIVMERLYGTSLREVIEQKEKISIGRLVQIVDQLLAALQAAHDKGIIHRDVKPENVFVCKGDVEGQDKVKVLDFGISKMTGGSEGYDSLSLTRTGTLVGTPLYMSPEQARGKTDIDHRADLYATGVILYRSLAGIHPYSAPNFNALVVAVATGQHAPLTKVAPHIPAPLAEIAEKAMARDREQRYQSAKELRQALRALPADVMSHTTGGGHALPELTGSGEGPTSSTGAGQKVPVAAAAPSKVWPIVGWAVLVIVVGVAAGWLWNAGEQRDASRPPAAAVAPARPDAGARADAAASAGAAGTATAAAAADAGQARPADGGSSAAGDAGVVAAAASSPGQPADIAVSVIVQPASATLTVDGEPKSNPLVTRLPRSPGEFLHIVASAKGHVSQTERVRRDSDILLTVKLVPERHRGGAGARPHQGHRGLGIKRGVE
jgi:hypothetical protein